MLPIKYCLQQFYRLSLILIISIAFALPIFAQTGIPAGSMSQCHTQGFLGDMFGIENNIKLAIITGTTVIIFDLQFWSLSAPTVINLERSVQE